MDVEKNFDEKNTFSTEDNLEKTFSLKWKLVSLVVLLLLATAAGAATGLYFYNRKPELYFEARENLLKFHCSSEETEKILDDIFNTPYITPDVNVLETEPDDLHDLNIYIKYYRMAANRIFYGEEPLKFAIDNNLVTLIKVMFYVGIDVNTKLKNGNSALFEAVTSPTATVEMVTAVLDAGGDIGFIGHDHDNLFILSCNSGRRDIAALLLKRKPSFLNDHGSFGKTALHQACQIGNLEIFEFLLRNGASLDINTLNGNDNLLHSAVRGSNIVICTRLLDFKPALVNGINIDSETPLKVAEKGNLTSISALLKLNQRLL